MATNTSIPYADDSLPIWKGCTKKSPGCKFCYAMYWSWRMQHNKKVADQYAGLVEKTAGGEIKWTGKLNLNEAAFDVPKKAKRPRTYFINTMSDFFDVNALDEWRKRSFDMMLEANWHRYLIFTKRPEQIDRMLDEVTGWRKDGSTDHIWFIVSVEDQKRAEERIPMLWNLPENMKVGISFEPLLTDIDLSFLQTDKLPYSWAIIGGESGHKARPADVDWFKSLIDQHTAHEVPVYMKQYGSFLAKKLKFKNPKGEDPFEWPEALWVRNVPNAEAVY